MLLRGKSSDVLKKTPDACIQVSSLLPSKLTPKSGCNLQNLFPLSKYQNWRWDREEVIDKGEPVHTRSRDSDQKEGEYSSSKFFPISCNKCLSVAVRRRWRRKKRWRKYLCQLSRQFSDYNAQNGSRWHHTCQHGDWQFTDYLWEEHWEP